MHTKPKFFLMRHGKVDGADALSPEGRAELVGLREKLAALGFKPQRAFASRTGRGRETMELMAQHARMKFDQALKVFGDPASTEKLIKVWPLREFADYLFELEVDTLVVSHDAAPTILALDGLRRRGVTLDWRELPDEQLHPAQGAGFLIDGDRLEYVTP